MNTWNTYFNGTDFILFYILVTQYGNNKNKLLEYQYMKSIINGKFRLSTLVKVVDFLNHNPSKLLSKMYKTLTILDESITLPISKWEMN